MKVCVITTVCVLSLVKPIWNLNLASREQEDMFASALVSIIRTFYVKESNNIIVTSNRDDPTHNSILRTVFSALDRNLSTTFVLHDHQDYLNGNIDRLSNIVLIDSYISFR